MPAQTHCAGKTGDKSCSPAELAGEYRTVSVVFPFGGLPWGQHRMDGDRWRRAQRPCAAGYIAFSVYHSGAGLQGGFPPPLCLRFVGAFFSTSQAQACQPGFAPQGDFLPDEKVTKESPKAGPSPALWNPPRGTGCPCVLLFAALGLAGSHRWIGNSTEYTCFSEK